MGKLSAFKYRARTRGQPLTLSAFQGWPTGDYVNAYAGEPDPDDPDYPVAAIPDPSYGEGRIVQGFVQPGGGQSRSDRYVRTLWGEDVEVALTVRIPGDESVAVFDKVVYGGRTLYVIELSGWFEGNTRVLWVLRLMREVPRAGV